MWRVVYSKPTKKGPNSSIQRTIYINQHLVLKFLSHFWVSFCPVSLSLSIEMKNISTIMLKMLFFLCEGTLVTPDLYIAPPRARQPPRAEAGRSCQRFCELSGAVKNKGLANSEEQLNCIHLPRPKGAAFGNVSQFDTEPLSIQRHQLGSHSNRTSSASPQTRLSLHHSAPTYTWLLPECW